MSKLTTTLDYFHSNEFDGLFPIYRDGLELCYPPHKDDGSGHVKFDLTTFIKDLRKGYNAWIHERNYGSSDLETPDSFDEDCQAHDCEEVVGGRPNNEATAKGHKVRNFYGFTQTKYDLLVEFHSLWLVTLKLQPGRKATNCQDVVESMKVEIQMDEKMSWKQSKNSNLQVFRNEIKQRVMELRLRNAVHVSAEDVVSNKQSTTVLSQYSLSAHGDQKGSLLPPRLMFDIISPDSVKSNNALSHLHQLLVAQRNNGDNTLDTKVMLQKGVQNWILGAMANHRRKPYVLQIAVKTLNLLVILDEEIRDNILYFDGLELVLHTMNVSQRIGNVQADCIRAIANLLQDDKPFINQQKLLFAKQMNGVDNIVRISNYFPTNDDVHLQSMRLLTKLTGVAELAPLMIQKDVVAIARQITHSNLFDDKTKNAARNFMELHDNQVTGGTSQIKQKHDGDRVNGDTNNNDATCEMPHNHQRKNQTRWEGLPGDTCECNDRGRREKHNFVYSQMTMADRKRKPFWLLQNEKNEKRAHLPSQFKNDTDRNWMYSISASTAIKHFNTGNGDTSGLRIEHTADKFCRDYIPGPCNDKMYFKKYHFAKTDVTEATIDKNTINPRTDSVSYSLPHRLQLPSLRQTGSPPREMSRFRLKPKKKRPRGRGNKKSGIALNTPAISALRDSIEWSAPTKSSPPKRQRTIAPVATNEGISAKIVSPGALSQAKAALKPNKT